MDLFNVVDCFGFVVPVQWEEGLCYGDNQIIGSDLNEGEAHYTAKHFNEFYINGPYRVVEAV